MFPVADLIWAIACVVIFLISTGTIALCVHINARRDQTVSDNNKTVELARETTKQDVEVTKQAFLTLSQQERGMLDERAFRDFTLKELKRN